MENYVRFNVPVLRKWFQSLWARVIFVAQWAGRSKGEEAEWEIEVKRFERDKGPDTRLLDWRRGWELESEQETETGWKGERKREREKERKREKSEKVSMRDWEVRNRQTQVGKEREKRESICKILRWRRNRLDKDVCLRLCECLLVCALVQACICECRCVCICVFVRARGGVNKTRATMSQSTETNFRSVSRRRQKSFSGGIGGSDKTFGLWRFFQWSCSGIRTGDFS